MWGSRPSQSRFRRRPALADAEFGEFAFWPSRHLLLASGCIASRVPLIELRSRFDERMSARSKPLEGPPSTFRCDGVSLLLRYANREKLLAADRNARRYQGLCHLPRPIISARSLAAARSKAAFAAS